MDLWRLLLLLSAAYRLNALKVYPPDQVTFLGRWLGGRGTSRRCSYGTVSFAVSFRGSSQLVARLQPYDVTMYHTCQVNGGDPFVLEHLSGDLVIASGLDPWATHSISCGRNTEAFYGATILDALLVDEGAVTLSPPRPSGELAVEFLGDSITAGYQALARKGATEDGPRWEDVFKTWAATLANAWGTRNWRTVAQSSIAVLPHNSYGMSFKALKDQFLCSELTLYQPCQRPWDFDEWQADVVVLNLGTNDFIFVDPTEAEFEKAYLELIQIVRSKYPGALIFCIIPLAQSCKLEAKWRKMIDGITKAVAAAGPDVELISTGSAQHPWLDCYRDYVDDVHPTQEGHLHFAQHLSPVMLPKLKQRFPWKCGDHCGEVPGASPTEAPTTTTTARLGGGALCCYPGCGDAQRSCNTEEDSPYCTRSADNCRNCGGEFCGALGTTALPTTAARTTAPETTTATTPMATTSAATTTVATTTAGAQNCCYPDCDSSVCNPSDNWCSRSTKNCRNCGGTLCGGRQVTTSSRDRTRRSTSTSTAATTTPSGTGDRCCYPDCSSDACNEPEDSPYCTSSPDNCRKCGGELCSRRGFLL
eukprot:s1241_g7.t1